jgi:hypothetical protein
VHAAPNDARALRDGVQEPPAELAYDLLLARGMRPFPNHHVLRSNLDDEDIPLSAAFLGDGEFAALESVLKSDITDFTAALKICNIFLCKKIYYIEKDSSCQTRRGWA